MKGKWNEGFALLHTHTTDSLRDSVMSSERLVERAVELGISAVAKTEHGTMIGYYHFWKLCKEAGINPILGVEAYVRDADDKVSDRHHLILMAKNEAGFRAISKAVTKSNDRVEKVEKLTFPMMDHDLIRKFFGKGSEGYGNVIATSACLSGVIAGIWYDTQTSASKRKLEKLYEKKKVYVAPDDPHYQKVCKEYEEACLQADDAKKRISDLKKLISKPTTALQKKVSTAKTAEKREAAEKNLSEVLKAKQAAEKALSELLPVKDQFDRKVKGMKQELSDLSLSVKKWEAADRLIREMEEQQKTPEECEAAMLEEATWYRDTFAPGDFYMEMQYHGMKEEKEIMPRIARLARKLNIPLVAANDAHIPTNSDDDVLARQIIRATAFDKWSDPSESDKELYIKNGEELADALLKILPEDVVEESMNNAGKIAGQCHVEIRKENHYPKFRAPNGKSPEEYLTELAYAGIPERYGKDWDAAKEERLQHELSVICSMGYASYFCIVQDFIEYARVAGKLELENPEEIKIARTFDVELIRKYVAGRPGECVGPGRGSAAGSIVCYLVGITNIDPIRYNLFFERFLNPERVSMPDIDVDIESIVRPFVVEYVMHKYGASAVCGIMAQKKETGRSALLTATRSYGLQKKGEATAYLDIGLALSKNAAAFAENELAIDLAKVKTQVLAALSGNFVASEIYRYAMLIEGCATSISQHAAGIIITDGNPVSDYVPLCWNESNQIMVTQIDMVEAEELGLLKIDFLGLNNLTIITQCLRMIEERNGQVIDMDAIPFEPAVFQHIFAEAMTNSVFQFESIGMKNMLKQFKPESIDDLVLLVAMFRPGPMQFLPNVIEIKNGRKSLEYLTAELEPILSGTYGAIAYQEQVQEIFKSLAGYSLGQADLVRRAMSKKKKKVLEAEHQAFIYGDESRNIVGCKANGISEEIANTLFDEVMDFAAYAFNRSHAACYAVVAYQTAWLKFYHPIEYMTAVLNDTKFEKFQGLISDLKDLDVEIVPPDINKSKLKFSIRDDKIQFGLGAIKGLGDSVSGIIAEQNLGEFTSLTDFVTRTLPDKKALEGFAWSGAFDCFTTKRKQIVDSIPKYQKAIKKVKDIKKKIITETDTAKRTALEKKLQEAVKQLKNVSLNSGVCDNQKELLAKERELLGAYVGKQPVDIYKAAPGTSTIGEALLSPGTKNMTIMGVITGLSVKARKADKAPLAFFNLTDRTGSIDACCFVFEYGKYQKFIAENEVVCVTGNVSREDDRTQFIIKKLTVPELNIPTITITVKDIADWMEYVRKIAVTYQAENGNPLIIYDEMMEEYRRTDLKVTPAILSDANVMAKAV